MRHGAGREEYDLVVVSDWHLMTRGPVAAEWKRRFIDTVRTPAIVCAGDMFDGQRINLHAPRDMHESEKRVMDSFNARAAAGTSIVWLPGNHDEELRGMDIFGAPRGEAGGTDRKWRAAFSGAGNMTFERDLNYHARHGVYHITHGDRFEPDSWHLYDIAEKRGMGFMRFWDSAYVRVIGGCGDIAMATGFNPLAAVMHAKDFLKRAAGKFNRAAEAFGRKEGYDGIVTGHTHHAYINTARDGFVQAVAGDGVETLTALGFRGNRPPELIPFRPYMRDLGPEKGNRAMEQKEAFRAATERQVGAIHAVWPGKIKTDWKKLLHLAP